MSGAVLVLAGSILFGSGVVGQEVCIAANRFPDWPPGTGMFIGITVGILGIGTLLVATARGSDLRTPPS
jgi:hypothetical protein